MTKYICDLCGKDCATTEIWIKKMGIEGCWDYKNTYDLCDDCKRKLLEFLGDENGKRIFGKTEQSETASEE